MRWGLATAACCLLAAPTAAADVKRAESIMPPGQSGFVSAPCLLDSSACDPHLTDQISPFVDFEYKNSMLGQPGVEETPKAGVRITRDEYGVPSVYGDTEDDMWWGMGYAIAQDRLFQIEAFRRATTGTLSEILGKAALEDDIVARRDFYTRAEREQMVESLPGDLRTRWQQYADGVNAWIDEVNSDPSKVPAEYAALGTMPEHLQVHEMAAIGIYLARTTPSDDGEELANLEGFQAVGRKTFNRVFPLRTPGQWGTVPRRHGPFPSRPGMTRKNERKAFKRSSRYAKRLPLPQKEEASASSSSTLARFFPSLAGSKMWAMRKLGHAWLGTGPQLGFVMPERLVEIELHSPSLNVRGTTAAGAPVIGIGHNEHVAWGVTSGLGDEDDLYAEQLVGDEGYRFRGETRDMECRDETFTYRPPPADFLALLDLEVPDTSSGSDTERICRTVHGPVQEVVKDDGVAYARRYAIWKREVGTILGLDAVNRASSIEDVDAAADKLTWNENLLAADDRGNIGYWNPGLLPLRSKRWDERLPFPGTGSAEWKGLLPVGGRPQVINPSQGFLANWNNPPSFGSTNGDGPAKERTIGPFHRGKFLSRIVGRVYRQGPSFEGLVAIDRQSGTHAQQRMLSTRRLKRAARRARGDAKVVLGAILAWNGDYATADSDGKVPPGVAAWDAFCAGAQKVATGRYPDGVSRLGHSAGGSHLQECSTLEAFGLRTLKRRGYRKAAVAAMAELEKEFGSKDPDAWKIDRPTYPAGSEGGGTFPEPFPFFDRGTWTELTELAP